MVKLKHGEWYHTNDSDPWLIKFDKITKSNGYTKVWYTHVILLDESIKIITKEDYISDSLLRNLRLPTEEERIKYKLTELKNVYELW